MSHFFGLKIEICIQLISLFFIDLIKFLLILLIEKI